MKRLFILSLSIILACGLSYAQGQLDKPKAKILLLISEQNIQGQAVNWWTSGAESSAMEANLTKLLQDLGFQIVDSSLVRNSVRKERAFRVVNLGDKEALHLGQISRAEYLVLGKATASYGSSMAGQDTRPCYANVTAKLIRARDGVVIARLDAVGSSANTDIVLAGKEALSNSAVDLAAKIVSNLTKEGGK